MAVPVPRNVALGLIGSDVRIAQQAAGTQRQLNAAELQRAALRSAYLNEISKALQHPGAPASSGGGGGILGAIEHAPMGALKFLGKTEQQVGDSLIHIPAGLLQLGLAPAKDIYSTVTGHPTLSHSLGLGEQMAKGMYGDLTHPLSRPGYALMDALTLYTGGEGIVARLGAGARAARAARAGEVAADLRPTYANVPRPTHLPGGEQFMGEPVTGTAAGLYGATNRYAPTTFPEDVYPYEVAKPPAATRLGRLQQRAADYLHGAPGTSIELPKANAPLSERQIRTYNVPSGEQGLIAESSNLRLPGQKGAGTQLAMEVVPRHLADPTAPKGAAGSVYRILVKQRGEATYKPMEFPETEHELARLNEQAKTLGLPLNMPKRPPFFLRNIGLPDALKVFKQTANEFHQGRPLEQTQAIELANREYAANRQAQTAAEESAANLKQTMEGAPEKQAVAQEPMVAKTPEEIAAEKQAEAVRQQRIDEHLKAAEALRKDKAKVSSDQWKSVIRPILADQKREGVVLDTPEAMAKRLGLGKPPSEMRIAHVAAKSEVNKAFETGGPEALNQPQFQMTPELQKAAKEKAAAAKLPQPPTAEEEAAAKLEAAAQGKTVLTPEQRAVLKQKISQARKGQVGEPAAEAAAPSAEQLAAESPFDPKAIQDLLDLHDKLTAQEAAAEAKPAEAAPQEAAAPKEKAPPSHYHYQMFDEHGNLVAERRSAKPINNYKGALMRDRPYGESKQGVTFKAEKVEGRVPKQPKNEEMGGLAATIENARKIIDEFGPNSITLLQRRMKISVADAERLRQTVLETSPEAQAGALEKAVYDSGEAARRARGKASSEAEPNSANAEHSSLPRVAQEARSITQKFTAPGAPTPTPEELQILEQHAPLLARTIRDRMRAAEGLPVAERARPQWLESYGKPVGLSKQDQLIEQRITEAESLLHDPSIPAAERESAYNDAMARVEEDFQSRMFPRPPKEEVPGEKPPPAPPQKTPLADAAKTRQYMLQNPDKFTPEQMAQAESEFQAAQADRAKVEAAKAAEPKPPAPTAADLAATGKKPTAGFTRGQSEASPEVKSTGGFKTREHAINPRALERMGVPPEARAAVQKEAAAILRDRPNLTRDQRRQVVFDALRNNVGERAAKPMIKQWDELINEVEKKSSGASMDFPPDNRPSAVASFVKGFMSPHLPSERMLGTVERVTKEGYKQEIPVTQTISRSPAVARFQNVGLNMMQAAAGKTDVLARHPQIARLVQMGKLDGRAARFLEKRKDAAFKNQEVVDNATAVAEHAFSIADPLQRAEYLQEQVKDRLEKYRSKTGKAGQAMDELNMLASMGVLYTKGTGFIIPNLLGQMFIAGTDAHWMPWKVYRAMSMVRRMRSADPTAYETAMAGMQQGIMDAVRSDMGPPGKVGQTTRGMMHFFSGTYGQVLDKPWRAAALGLEMMRRGIKTPEEAVDLFRNPARRGEMLNTLQESNLNAIDYTRMGANERTYLRRVVFFYPWIKASARWTGRMAAHHPAQLAAEMQAGGIAQKKWGGLLPHMPSYLEGAIPGPNINVPLFGNLGHEHIPGVGNVPRVFNPASAAVQGTTGDLLNTMGANMAGGVSANDLPTKFLNPIATLGLEGLTRTDPFTGQKFPATMSDFQIAGQEAGQVFQPWQIYSGMRQGGQISAGNLPGIEKKLEPRTQQDVLGRTFVGMGPTPINPKVSESRYQAEQAGLVSTNQKVLLKNQTSRQAMLDGAQRAGVIPKGGKLPPDIRQAFIQQGQREMNIANWQQKFGHPLQPLERLFADLNLLVRQKRITAQRMQEIYNAAKLAPQSRIEQISRPYREMANGNARLLAYRRHINAMLDYQGQALVGR